MAITGKIRRGAQLIRHFPGLRKCDFLWDWLRPLYKSLLGSIAAGKGISVTVGGVQVFIDPAYGTTSFETVEMESYAAMRRYLKPGDTFYDVGAAIGCYTMVAAQAIGETGRIVAFEPDPEARSFLNRHLQWNHIAERVTVRPVCCSQRAGKLELYVSPTDVGGQASLIAQSGFTKILVDATCLDDEFLQNGHRPKVVKIDVEGAEWDVLQGAQTLLREVRPTLLLSIHPAIIEPMGITESQIITWLKDRGYQCEVLERDHEVHVLAKPIDA